VRQVLDERRELLVVGGAAMAAMALGMMVVRSPLLALVGIGALGVAVTALRFGALAFAGAALALLPWLVVMEGVAPALLGTLTAAGATGALLWCAFPLRFDSPLVPAAGAAFVAIVAINAALASDGEQLTQAAKYIVFATLAVTVSSVSARELMPSLKIPLLASCAAAMVVHLLVIAAGLGESESYYGTGEKLGFAADGPHALALLSTIVAAAGLTVKRTELQIALFALGLVPALLTGVRSALLAIAVILVVYLVQSRVRLRAVVVLVAIAAIALVSGAADVVTARFAAESGDFSSLSSAGSGRGLIWTVAIEGWQAAGPFAWIFGAGLRSVVEFEVAALASGFVGHSDVIEVLVQLGIVGFVSWLALWLGLLRAGLAAIVLLPILVFGIVNGTLEYVAAITLGLCLAAACADRREPGAA
jgi:hypothetical protein